MDRDTTHFDRAEQPSMGRLIGELVADVQDLIRGEVALAKTELKEEAQRAGLGAGMLAGAGVLGLVGLIFVGLTLTYALSLVLPPWAAALIVALLFLGGAAALFMVGKGKLQHVNPVPQQSIDSLKENAEWVKQQISSDKS